MQVSDPPTLEPNIVVDDLNTFPREQKPLGMWVMVRVYVRVCVCSLRKGRGKNIWGEMVPCGQKQVIVQTTIQSLQSVSTGRGSWGAERERDRQTDRQRDRERASASGLRDVDWRLVWRQRFCLLPEHLKAVEGDTIQSTFLELQLQNVN